MILYFSVGAPCLGKFWCRTDRSKCSHPIGFQDPLITNISGRNQVLSLNGDSYYRKVSTETITSG